LEVRRQEAEPALWLAGSPTKLFPKHLPTPHPADFKLKKFCVSRQTVKLNQAESSCHSPIFILFPVLLIPPPLYLSLCGQVLRRQNTRSVDCIVMQRNKATLLATQVAPQNSVSVLG